VSCTARVVRRATIALAGLLASTLFLGVLQAPVLAADVALSVTVDGGKYKAVRLRNLPKDANMAVMAQSTGRISLSLISEADYKSFGRATQPMFAGVVDPTLSFQIAIPQSGHYYLLLDNRQSAEVRKVKLGIRARPRASQPGEQPAPQPGQGERKEGT
jgi:hypothetical protein